MPFVHTKRFCDTVTKAGKRFYSLHGNNDKYVGSKEQRGCIWSKPSLKQILEPRLGLVKLVSSSSGTIPDLEYPNQNQEKLAPMEFGNFKDAFKPKRTSDIVRALSILQLSSYDAIVNNAEKIIEFGRKMFGRRFFDFLLKNSVYKQFVGGKEFREIKESVCRLHEAGIQTMLAVPIEEDLDQNTANKNPSTIYEKNLQLLLKCIDLEQTLQPKFPITQIRVTAIASASILAKISQICPNPTDTCSTIDDIVNAMKTGKRVTMEGLTESESTELNDVIKRLVVIAEVAKEKGVMIMVDAEYTYFNGATKLFVLSLMLRYNHDKPLICFTYQNYLKATLEQLKQDVEFINSRDVYFGLKLVRGAYMYREREIAKAKGCSDPIHDTAQDTSNMYHQSINFLMERIASNKKCAFMAASHNEETVKHMMKKIKEYNINPGGGQIFFGQLYGMCDHISYTLGKAGFPIYKSVPYGEIDHTLPYLVRRAQENRSIIPGARREKELLKKALWHRIS
ncbi:hydroxyproline dehydrogenase isoform X1 [Patella vulgata]|uniref:hydroxyproline dehydrogenase isoform X1 n=1 Tax=Patella vulgata TaxID=6465 RepID=UPI00217F80D0|nr:hydroxyproline dehydrogenase isoform X1 [Patella vulgata]